MAEGLHGDDAPATGPVSIRPAAPADAGPAAEITREAFDGISIDQAIERLCGRSAGGAWQDIKAQQVRREFARTPRHCFVATIGGRVVGYVTTAVSAEIGRGTIANLAVAADCRGRGLGRALIARALDHFRALGLTQAKIETLAHNDVGNHLYPAMGFTEIVRQVHYAMPL